MKRMTAVVATAGLLAGGILFASSPAYASETWAYAYTGTNYSGREMIVNSEIDGYQNMSAPVNSFINHTSRTIFGYNWDGTARYTFEPSRTGGWSWIGAPFTSSGPRALTSFYSNR